MYGGWCLFWTQDVFASRLCSLWLVKVCQWVTLTPVQGCREEELLNWVTWLFTARSLKQTLQNQSTKPREQRLCTLSLLSVISVDSHQCFWAFSEILRGDRTLVTSDFFRLLLERELARLTWKKNSLFSASSKPISLNFGLFSEFLSSF